MQKYILFLNGNVKKIFLRNGFAEMESTVVVNYNKTTPSKVYFEGVVLCSLAVESDNP